MVQATLGLAIGVPIALICVRFVKAQLYEIPGADMRVMGGAVLTLAAAACIAGLIPARRAASTDPARFQNGVELWLATLLPGTVNFHS
jgi:ABC-type antimicrobial peptide transport system permease subunit